MSIRKRALVCITAAWLAFACIATASAQDQQGTDDEAKQAQFDAKIAKLIEQLGDEEYAVRERAKNELARIGLSAFDALDEAERHRDLEIGRQAHYLIRSFDVVWSRDTDAPEVKSILKGYGHRMEPDERRTRIERLARLDDRAGWDALGRMARFESDQGLARLAAYLIIQSTPPSADEAERAAGQLQRSAAQSRRTSAQWLRTYARTLPEPETAQPEWDRLIDEQFESLASSNAADLDPWVAVQLARWHVESLLKLGNTTDAGKWATRLSAYDEGGKNWADYLQEHIEWSAKQEMWPHILEVAKKHSAAFAENPRLLYSQAFAQANTGDNQGAEATGATALALNPDNAAAHDEVGEWLAKRGRFTWAEKEYRHVLDTNPLDSRFNYQCRSKLAEMFHDQAQELSAAQTLQPLLDESEKNPQFAERLPRSLEGIGSRMNYFYAMHHVQKKEYDKARQRLELGIEADASDADVLIALYRLPEQTEEQKTKVRDLIEKASGDMQLQIEEASRQLAQNDFQFSATLKHRLALEHNQYAWLVSNTTGDYQSALASSKESLRLRPDQPEYLDTLGRSYYAAGDLPNAIKAQKLALKNEPFSGQMRRQLEFFESELEKKK